MAVIGVLAETVVGDYQDIFYFSLDRPNCTLNDAVFGVSLAPGFVLFVGNSEQNRGPDAVTARGLDLLHELVDRKIEAAGHRSKFATHAFALTNKQRIDKVIRCESRLADH